MITGAGLLGEIAACFDRGEVFYLPPIGFRAVLENCARTMRVLGADPAEGPQARLARAYLEALVSAEQSSMQGSRLGADPDLLKRKKGEFQQLRSQIITVFPGTTMDDLGGKVRQISGQQLLGPEKGVEWMFELLAAEADSTISVRQALGIYGLLSNFTHPTLHVTREMRQWAQDGDDVVSVHQLDLDFVERQARLGVVVFYNAMAYVASYFGWPRTEVDTLTGRIESVMPGTFNS